MFRSNNSFKNIKNETEWGFNSNNTVKSHTLNSKFLKSPLESNYNSINLKNVDSSALTPKNKSRKNKYRDFNYDSNRFSRYIEDTFQEYFQPSRTAESTNLNLNRAKDRSTVRYFSSN
jgi:hypothetical protein